MSEGEHEIDILRDDDSEEECEIEVSATFVRSQPPGRKSGTKATARKTKVFKADMSRVTLGAFTRLALTTLGLWGTAANGIVVPFTYYHKGRTIKHAPTVNSEDDFRLLLGAIKSKGLSALNIEFSKQDLTVLGISKESSAADTDNSLALSTGIPCVSSLLSLATERARIVGLLQVKWKCSKKGHKYCYTCGKIHGRLSHTHMNTWANYVHDGIATILEPPKDKSFDFEAQQAEIDARTSTPSSKSLLGPSATSSNTSDLAQAVLPLFQLLSSTFTGATAHVTNAPAPSPPCEPSPPIALVLNNVLDDFLQFAQDKFGASPAAYQDALAHERIGPDVLEEMGLADLTSYGVPIGDVYRLKRACHDL